MAQPIDFMVNLAQVSEVGRQQQIERDRPEGERAHRALTIKLTSHLSEEQVEALSHHAASRVEPRNEGEGGAGYYGGGRQRKKEEEREEKEEELLYLPPGFHPDKGRQIDIVK